jgi:hypothetical protein
VYLYSFEVIIFNFAATSTHYWYVKTDTVGEGFICPIIAAVFHDLCLAVKLVVQFQEVLLAPNLAEKILYQNLATG